MECEALSDFELMESSLESVAEKGEDITDTVYRRFFAARPDAQHYFNFEDIDPQGRGRMLTELLEMLRDQARGRTHVRDAMQAIAADHISYGVTSVDLYSDFLQALRTTLSEYAAGDWSVEVDSAWRRQCAELLDGVRQQRR